MATWIHPDGSVEAVRPAAGGFFTVEELQRYVGGFFEIVRPHLRGWQTLYMVVNEDGKRLGLPTNQKATDIYAHPGLPAGPLPPNVLLLGTPEDFARVVGDVLLCDETEIN